MRKLIKVESIESPSRIAKQINQLAIKMYNLLGKLNKDV